ncbi:MAG: energy-coupling factor ABC transporter substrate-binding protein [Bacillota bacterium]
MSLARTNLMLTFLVLLLMVTPLVIKQGAEFGGADGQAEEIIAEIQPGYQPWFEALWEPPSGEIESLLFTLQAAMGSGFIGYYLGYARGKRTRDHAKGEEPHHAAH